MDIKDNYLKKSLHYRGHGIGVGHSWQYTTYQRVQPYVAYQQQLVLTQASLKCD